MVRTLVFTALLGASAVGQATAACAPGDITITRVVSKGAMHDGSLNDVRVAVTVRNASSSKQPGNALQSVTIYQSGRKVGSKGIPPLAGGQAFTFIYTFQRSSEAPAGTTQLVFGLAGYNAAGSACIDANQHYRINV